jgi:hypothetical protein
MKKFYVSSMGNGSSDDQYSTDFYRLVLSELEYELIDSSADVSVILTAIASRDLAHIEVGPEGKREWELLHIMLKANYRNIAVTLHQSHLFRYPVMKQKNAFFTSIVKWYYQWIGNYRVAKKYLSKIRCIYVLSPKAKVQMELTFKLQNVFYLPKLRKSHQDGVTSAQKEMYNKLLGQHAVTSLQPNN